MGYHFLSKLTHWSSALIILGLLFLGFYMTSLSFSDFTLKLYLWHKSFGLLVLGLFVTRLLFLFALGKPKACPDHNLWERILARVIHFALYGALLLMPLSGWVMSSAGDYTVQFFGIHLPDIVQKDEALYERAKAFHEILSFLLIGSIALHGLGAFKHHFIDADDTLKRMTSISFGVKSGLILVALFIGALFSYSGFLYKKISTVKEKAVIVESVPASYVEPISAQAPSWAIVLEDSSMVFEAEQYGQVFEGRFERFEGQIFFDSANLDQSRVRIDVDISSLKTGSADRDAQAMSAVWFDASQYSHAVFEADDFERLENDRYIAKGTLSVRDIRLPFDLPFDLKIADGKALMRSVFSVERLDYDVGLGQSEQAVSNKVSFDVIVTALER